MFEVVQPDGSTLFVRFRTDLFGPVFLDGKRIHQAQYKESDKWVWAGDELNALLTDARIRIDADVPRGKTAEKNARKYAAVAAFKGEHLTLPRYARNKTREEHDKGAD